MSQHDDGAAGPAGTGSGGAEPGRLPWHRRAARWLPWRLARRIRSAERRLAELRTLIAEGDDRVQQLLERRFDRERGEIDARADRVEHRLDGLEQLAGRLDRLEEGRRELQTALEAVAAHAAAAGSRLDTLESAVGRRSDALEAGLRELDQETGRLRDDVVPAITARADALLGRLAEELEETSSLVERLLLGEPLPLAPAPGGAVEEAELAAGLAEVQPLLVESFRGSEAEIRHRLDRYLPLLAENAPVLDLGCGRGELLLMLREAGVEASGIEADPALVAAARRRGLAVTAGDVLGDLSAMPDGTLGAATAIHLVEHLPLARLPGLLAQIRRLLRPGGVLVLELPDVHNLRVGAALFWIDPTHRRPLPVETLELLLTAGGFELVSRDRLHPFPPEQQLRRADDPTRHETVPAALAARLDHLEGRLDELLNGPRDVAVVARRGGA